MSFMKDECGKLEPDQDLYLDSPKAMSYYVQGNENIAKHLNTSLGILLNKEFVIKKLTTLKSDGAEEEIEIENIIIRIWTSVGPHFVTVWIHKKLLMKDIAVIAGYDAFEEVDYSDHNVFTRAQFVLLISILMKTNEHI